MTAAAFAVGWWVGSRSAGRLRGWAASLRGVLERANTVVEAPAGVSPEVRDVTRAVGQIVHEAQARLREVARERDGLTALLDRLAEGVVELSEDARVVRANRSARALLELPEGVRFAPAGAVVRNPEVRALMEASLTADVPARDVSLGERRVVVAGRTLAPGGAVITLLDVTEARHAERVRRDFVANASHELKTPLTAVRGFAETLLEDDPPPDLARRFLTSIRDNTVRLQHLVDDLLDLSRLDSGRWVPRNEPIVVADVARAVWEELRGPEHSLDFVVDADVEVAADRAGLTHILRNLLENALRHTDDGGRIEVRARRGGDGGVTVEVSDTGEGIPSRALPRIFERFYRADSARARDAGGTGLGLSIVRRLVGAMGGVADVDSELGRGTTLRFTLPAPGGPG